jgi:hypothetical protein
MYNGTVSNSLKKTFPALVCLMFLVASVLYVYLTFTAPITSTSQDFGITENSLFYIRLTIIIPYLATCFFGAVGFKKLYVYFTNLENAKEEKPLNGLVWAL